MENPFAAFAADAADAADAAGLNRPFDSKQQFLESITDYFSS